MNDTIYFDCPHCKAELKLPPDVARPGDNIHCPACDKVISRYDADREMVKFTLRTETSDWWGEVPP